MRSFVGGPPYLIWSGSVSGRVRYTGRLRVMQRRLIAARASGAVAYGSRAAGYLTALGMPASRIFTGINTVDTTFFATQTDALRQTDRSDDERRVLTYVGYLSTRKNVAKLLDVVRQLARQRSDFVLEIVGDGEERAALEQYAAAHGISAFVRFCGYRQQPELPAFYARSTCFLYQTDFDIWGLVLVEAMAAGLACFASTNAGATADLIRHGDTGFAVDFNGTEAVAASISRLLDRPEEARQIGARARAFIAEHATIEKSAAGFVRAITTVLHPQSEPALCNVVQG
jgi:glycosyltransferase involved in cell wall biosynthesis